MPVNLSIKEVPEGLAARLRARAARNHRSLQRELMAIVEAAAEGAEATVLTANSIPAPAYVVTALTAADGTVATDNLLDELDAIVADSQWGHAAVLTRDQAHDRRLQRELDFDARRAEAAERSLAVSPAAS
jgi:plasmid stability protein